MLHAPAREPEWQSWTWVALWSISIFVAIPLARAVEGLVRENLGQSTFGWVVIALSILATIAALGAVRRSGPIDRDGRRSQLVWLLGIGAFFVGATLYLWSNPEESFHFVQYGGLALLLHRALAHRMRDAAIYWVGALLAGLVGCVDETIQWITPGRYWGARDLVINLFAATLVELAIAKGLRPPYIAPGIGTGGAVAICRTLLASTSVLFCFAMNTPQRVDVYAGLFPGLGFLADNESTMMEYGYRYEEPGIGEFRSRLTKEQLRAEDERRAESAAAVLDEYFDEALYGEFLKVHPAQHDAFLHELKVHLFRRDVFAGYAASRPYDPVGTGKVATIAIREQRIVERYFGRTYAASRHVLDPEVYARLESLEDPDRPYVSRVSIGLVTGISERQIGLGFLLVIAALVVVERRLTRRRSLGSGR